MEGATGIKPAPVGFERAEEDGKGKDELETPKKAMGCCWVTDVVLPL